MTVPGTTTTVEALAGYHVEVWQGGAADGRPTLLLGGTPGGRFDAAIAGEAARRSGVALWSFNRPGYVRSALTPPGLAATGVLALQVADARGIGRFDVVGLSGGGPGDSVSFANPWDIDPSEVNAPTWLWYGGKETMVPVAHGRWLADRIP